MVQQNWISLERIKLTTARKTPSPRTDLEYEFGNLLAELEKQDDEARKATLNKVRTFVTRKQISKIILDKSDYGKIAPVLIGFLKKDFSSASHLLERLGRSISDYLIDALEHSHPNIRKNTTYLLGKFKESKAVIPLLEILQNEEDETVRSQAIWALGEIGDKRATDPILRILEDESNDDKTHAISALKELKDPKTIDALIPILEDENWKVRRAVIDTLGEIDDERVVKLLIKSLDDKHLESPALWKLAEYSDSWIFELLFDRFKDTTGRDVDLSKLLEKMLSEQTLNIYIQALKNEHWQVKSNAAVLLGKFGSKQAFEPLLEALSDDNSDVRCRVIWALGEIRDERAIIPLVSMFKEDIDDKENGFISYALQNIGNQSEKAILDFMESNPDIVSYPIMTLGRIGGEKSEEKLILGLENPSEDVRIAAMEGLGRIKSSKAIEPIIEKLKDESRRVRGSAVKALTMFGGDRVFNAFVENLVNKEGYVDSNIVEALGVLGDLRAVDYLIKTLNQGYNREVVKVLGKLGDPRAAQPIIDNLAYTPEDMPSAAYALVKLGDKGIEAIFDLIRTGGLPYEVEPAAAVLSEIKDIKYLDTIIELLSYENRVPNYVIERVRGFAIEALVNFNDPRVIDILIEIIQDDSVLVSMRRSAIRAIVNVNDPRVVDILIETLEDNYAIEQENLILRWNAIKALGDVKDPRSIKSIIEVLSYCPNHIVKRETKKYVIEALEKFDKETVVDTLIEMLKSKDAKVREGTVWVLGKMKDSRVLGPLEDLYENETDHRVLFGISQILDYFQ